MFKQKAQWSYNEFLTYILLYTASIDMDVTPEEKELFFSKIGALKYEDVLYIFKKENDSERLKTIISFKDKYYKDDSAKEDLLKDIKEMFLADQKFSPLEVAIYNGLRRIIR